MDPTEEIFQSLVVIADEEAPDCRIKSVRLKNHGIVNGFLPLSGGKMCIRDSVRGVLWRMLGALPSQSMDRAVFPET